MIAVIHANIEHAIGRIKQYTGASSPYSSIIEEIDQDLNTVYWADQLSLHLGEIRDGRFKIGWVEAPRCHLSRHSNHLRQHAVHAVLHPARIPLRSRDKAPDMWFQMNGGRA